MRLGCGANHIQGARDRRTELRGADRGSDNQGRTVAEFKDTVKPSIHIMPYDPLDPGGPRVAYRRRQGQETWKKAARGESER